MIQVPLSTLTTKELYTLGLRISELCSGVDAELTGIKLYQDNFSTNFANYEAAMHKIQVKAEMVDMADSKRDDLLIGIKTNLKSFLYHPDEQKKNAATSLLNTIAQNGDSIYEMSYKVETAVLEKLFSDVEEKHLADLELLGLSDWFDELKTAQSDFESKLHDYTSGKAGEKELSSPTAHRPALTDAIRKLLAFIPLQAEITGDESLKQLAEQLIVEVGRF